MKLEFSPNALHSILLILTFLCFVSYIKNEILASRNDQYSDIIVYINGQAIRPQGLLTMPAFEQVAGIVLANGQRIPPGSKGVVNMRIDLFRATPEEVPSEETEPSVTNNYYYYYPTPYASNGVSHKSGNTNPNNNNSPRLVNGFVSFVNRLG